jgi:hypothetical protein
MSFIARGRATPLWQVNAVNSILACGSQSRDAKESWLTHWLPHVVKMHLQRWTQGPVISGGASGTFFVSAIFVGSTSHLVRVLQLAVLAKPMDGCPYHTGLLAPKDPLPRGSVTRLLGGGSESADSLEIARCRGPHLGEPHYRNPLDILA